VKRLVSKFAFKRVNFVCRYAEEGGDGTLAPPEKMAAAIIEILEQKAGRRALTPPDPRLKGAWYPGGLNPRTYQVKNRF
jgi:hypothetical protein